MRRHHWRNVSVQCLKCLPVSCSHDHFHVKLIPESICRRAPRGAYLAEAAFSQHLVEHQVVHVEAYPGNCRCVRAARAQALARLAVSYKCTFAHRVNTYANLNAKTHANSDKRICFLKKDNPRHSYSRLIFDDQT